MTAEEDKEELQRLAYEAQAIRRQGEKLQQQISELQESLGQLDASIESLKSLKGDSSTMVPLGSGAFAPARIDSKTILIEVGAGVLVEKEPADAIGLLEERGKRVDSLREKMIEEINYVNSHLREMDKQAREIMKRLQKAGEIPVESGEE